MSNPFFVNTIDLLPATKARAGDVEANLTAVEAGFDEAKEYFDRTLRGARANPAIAELPNAATRANKALTFDAAGNPVTTVTTTEISNAQTYAVNADASATAAANSASAAAGSASTANAAATNPNVVAVGSDLLGADTIGTVATNIANVNATGSNIASVNTVAGISANVTTVAGNTTNVNTVAGISANVTTVSGIAPNVTTVAGVSGSVTTVAGISSSVTTVAGIAPNVTTVANNSANVTTVAANIASVNSAATNMAAIIDAPNQASAAAASAAAAAASYDSFDDRYLGSKASDPTLDNDGNALLTGALYWNAAAQEMRVWMGSAWVATYLPAAGYVTLNGTETLTNKTLTAPVLTTPDSTENVQIISGNTTAVRSRTYVLTATLTLTLPASPAAGDWVSVINRSGTTTPVIARNGSNIMGLAEDLTLDSANAPVTLVYADATRGWVFGG